MSEKYAFIDAQYAQQAAHHRADDPPAFRVEVRLLRVANRLPSDAQMRREELKIKVKAPFDEFGGTYGCRRIHAELARPGAGFGSTPNSNPVTQLAPERRRRRLRLAAGR